MNHKIKEMGGKARVTINDVAQKAGVSKGTVDRVMHNRGEVSSDSREKVLKTVEELGFRPNIHASVLASKKDYRIVCIIPEFNQGEFWELIAQGIKSGGEDASKYGVVVEGVFYDQYSVEAFKQACCRALDSDPVGIVIAPMFADETMRFARKLVSKGICYAYIDSKIEEDENYLAYFGMPMYRSGLLCADILASISVLDKINIIRIDRDRRGLYNPTLMRRTGFLDYIHDVSPSCEICNVFINPKDRKARYDVLDEMFENNPARNIVMFNSRIYLLTEYLRERNIRGRTVLGYDMLEKNIEALRDGYVKCLIAQHSDRQIRSAINAIVEMVLFKQTPARRDNYMPMDLLTKYNCDYYLL